MNTKSYKLIFYYTLLNPNKKPIGFDSTVGLMQIASDEDPTEYARRIVTPHFVEESNGKLNVINVTVTEITEEDFDREEKELYAKYNIIAKG